MEYRMNTPLEEGGEGRRSGKWFGQRRPWATCYSRSALFTSRRLVLRTSIIHTKRSFVVAPATNGPARRAYRYMRRIFQLQSPCCTHTTQSGEPNYFLAALETRRTAPGISFIYPADGDREIDIILLISTVWKHAKMILIFLFALIIRYEIHSSIGEIKITSKIEIIEIVSA